MAKNVDLQAAKERKQKKIAAVGGVLLVIVLFVQVPRTLKMMNGDAEPAAAAAPAAASPAPATAPPPAATVSPAPEQTVTAATLVSFSRFASKDPFVQQVKAKEGPPAEVPPDSSVEVGNPTGAIPDDGEGPDPKPAVKTSAQIEVNGVAELVSVGTPFPAANPLFLLASVSAKSVAVKVAEGGSFASGDPTLTLRLGRPVTLVNTADGTRFVLKLTSVS